MDRITRRALKKAGIGLSVMVMVPCKRSKGNMANTRRAGQSGRLVGKPDALADPEVPVTAA
jgi:hypothetical protein